MYLDMVLFVIGGLLLLTAFVFLIALIKSKKEGQEYQRILREETERIDVLTTLESSRGTQNSSSDAPSASTEIVYSTDSGTYATEIVADTERDSVVSGELDASVLEDQYELLREIHGGNLSRVFLARHKKLGYECLIKYIAGDRPDLLNEAEILKKMNRNMM